MKAITQFLHEHFSKMIGLRADAGSAQNPAALRRQYAAALLEGIQATQAETHPGIIRHMTQPHFIPFSQKNAVERLHQDLLGKWYDERGIFIAQDFQRSSYGDRRSSL